MWDIWAIGDYKFLASVLDSIAAWVGTGMPYRLATIGMIISAIVMSFQGVIAGGKMPQFQNLLLGWVFFFVLFGPGVTVIVKDSYSLGTVTVGNVPFGVAAAGSILSNIGHEVTASMEQAFSLPRMTEGGFAAPLSLLLRARNLDLGPANNHIAGAGNPPIGDLMKTLTNYVQDCTLVGIQQGAIKEQDILTSPQHWAKMGFASDVFYTRTFLPTTAAEGAGINRSCTEAFDAINNHMGSSAFWNGWTPYIDTILGQNSVGQTELALNAMVGVGADARDFLLASIFREAYELGIQKGQLSANDWGGIMITESARNQRNVQWAAESSLFMTVVRPMMTFFEAFIYAVTPFMAFLVVLVPIGISLIGKYAMMAIWIQLWSPVMAVLNFFINFIAQGKLAAADLQMSITSIAGMEKASSHMADWLATAGTLAASTPAITLALVYGGAVTASALTNKLGGGDFINEKALAPDALNQGAGVSMNHAQWDAIGGLRGAGADRIAPTISFGDDLKTSVESSHQALQQSSLDFGQAWSQLAGKNVSFQNLGQNLNSFSDRIQESTSQTASWLKKQATEIGSSLGLDQANTQRLAGVLGLGFSGSSTDFKGFQAGKTFTQGDRQAFMKGLKADLSEHFDSSQVDRIMEQLGERGAFEENSGMRGEFTQALAHDIAKTNGTIFTGGKSVSNDSTLSQKAGQVVKAADAYREGLTHQSNFGMKTEASLVDLSHQAVKNGALPALDQAVERAAKNNPEVGSEMAARTGLFKQNYGMNAHQARAAAAFTVLDRLASKNGEEGLQARKDLLAATGRALGHAPVDVANGGQYGFSSDPRSNQKIGENAKDEGQKARGTVTEEKLREKAPQDPGTIQEKVAAGLKATQQRATDRQQVWTQWQNDLASIRQLGAVEHGAMAGQARQTGLDRLQDVLDHPSMAQSVTEKAAGGVRTAAELIGHGYAAAFAMADGGARGALEGAKKGFDQTTDRLLKALGGGAAEGAGWKGLLRDWEQSATNLAGKISAGLNNVVENPKGAWNSLSNEVREQGGELIEQLKQAAESPSETTTTALQNGIQQIRGGLEVVNSALAVPLATAEGAATGTVEGAYNAVLLNDEVFREQKFDYAQKMGLTDEQARLYSDASTDFLSRTLSVLSNKDGLDFTTGGSVDQMLSSASPDAAGRYYGHRVGRTEGEAILRAAHTGNDYYLRAVGALNKIDGKTPLPGRPLPTAHPVKEPRAIPVSSEPSAEPAVAFAPETPPDSFAQESPGFPKGAAVPTPLPALAPEPSPAPTAQVPPGPPMEAATRVSTAAPAPDPLPAPVSLDHPGPASATSASAMASAPELQTAAAVAETHGTPAPEPPAAPGSPAPEPSTEPATPTTAISAATPAPESPGTAMMATAPGAPVAPAPAMASVPDPSPAPNVSEPPGAPIVTATPAPSAAPAPEPPPAQGAPEPSGAVMAASASAATAAPVNPPMPSAEPAALAAAPSTAPTAPQPPGAQLEAVDPVMASAPTPLTTPVSAPGPLGAPKDSTALASPVVPAPETAAQDAPGAPLLAATPAEKADPAPESLAIPDRPQPHGTPIGATASTLASAPEPPPDPAVPEAPAAPMVTATPGAPMVAAAQGAPAAPAPEPPPAQGAPEPSASRLIASASAAPVIPEPEPPQAPEAPEPPGAPVVAPTPAATGSPAPAPSAEPAAPATAPSTETTAPETPLTPMGLAVDAQAVVADPEPVPAPIAPEPPGHPRAASDLAAPTSRAQEPSGEESVPESPRAQVVTAPSAAATAPAPGHPALPAGPEPPEAPMVAAAPEKVLAPNPPSTPTVSEPPGLPAAEPPVEPASPPTPPSTAPTAPDHPGDPMSAGASAMAGAPEPPVAPESRGSSKEATSPTAPDVPVPEPPPASTAPEVLAAQMVVTAQDAPAGPALEPPPAPAAQAPPEPPGAPMVTAAPETASAPVPATVSEPPSFGFLEKPAQVATNRGPSSPELLKPKTPPKLDGSKGPGGSGQIM